MISLPQIHRTVSRGSTVATSLDGVCAGENTHFSNWSLAYSTVASFAVLNRGRSYSQFTAPSMNSVTDACAIAKVHSLVNTRHTTTHTHGVHAPRSLLVNYRHPARWWCVS